MTRFLTLLSGQKGNSICLHWAEMAELAQITRDPKKESPQQIVQWPEAESRGQLGPHRSTYRGTVTQAVERPTDKV
ncbi:hypothetical protein NDU88_004139 [Pleurodeles waltl]|uniref:Uncharacterized protein n=1 Tax=Pleurodeles waltl TaxID=8319 RepID=A0AAV7MFR5_PLEWA|nr:hypothetical protein NDU88_004139 [Pleurodeles waltl]